MQMQGFIEGITSAGFHCHFDGQFDYCHTVVGRRGRYVCCLAEAAEGNVVFPVGLCLAVQIGDEFTLCATFGGVTYMLPHQESATDFVIEALSMTTRRPTATAPMAVLQKYHVERVEVISFTSPNEADYLNEVSKNVRFPYSRREFIDRSSEGLQTTDRSQGMVSVKYGSAEALTRILEKGDSASTALKVIFVNGARETDDAVLLLRAMLSRLNVVAYNDIWGGKRIDLHDSFYSLPSLGPRPSSPANWTQPLSGDS